jgi:5'-nucleotidase
VRILLTNDDGIDSSGIRALREALEPDHELWVIAPESNRSGMGHSVTLADASRLRPRGDRVFAASGTPVDCVLIGLLAMVPLPVDMVLSGVNHGPNLGTDVLYSGTAAAAREATRHGVPGVALSLCRRDPPLDFRPVAAFVARNLVALRDISEPGFFLNLNFPSNGVAYRAAALTVPCIREYRDRLVTYRSPRGDLYCFLTGEPPEARPGEATDHDAVERGLISVSPLAVEPGSRESSTPALDGLRFDA